MRKYNKLGENMSKLTKLMEYSNASTYDKKKMLNSNGFKTIIGEEKHLLLSEAGEGSTKKLIQSEILSVLQTGAESQSYIRNILPVMETSDNYQAKVAYGTNPYDYAEYIAEGANITVDFDNYDNTTITINKAAIRPLITNEMIEDCRFGVIEIELMRAGAQLENTLNQKALTVMLDDQNGTTPADIDPAGTHIGISEVTNAYSKVADQGWTPTDGFFHPSVMGYISGGIDDWNSFRNFTGLNMRFVNTSVESSATSGWTSTDSANNYQGLVFDRTRYAVIAMREDINVTEFRDPIHDVRDLVVKARFGVGVLNDDAAVRILSK